MIDVNIAKSNTVYVFDFFFIHSVENIFLYAKVLLQPFREAAAVKMTDIETANIRDNSTQSIESLNSAQRASLR